MKKINKKGFTLIELLVVLVILSIIMVIAIPSVTSSIERSKEKQKNQVIKLAESAAELYVDSHKNSTTGSQCISIKTLIDNGYITTDEAKDPSNEEYTICGCVSYNSQDKTFTWSSRDSGADKENYRYKTNK